MTPRHVRRRPPSRPKRSRLRPAVVRRPGAPLALLVALALAVCAGAAACGGSSGSPGASPSAAAPTPVPSPQITAGAPPAGAVHVVRQFWKLVGEDRLSEAQRFLTSPGSGIRHWTDSGVSGARVVRVVADSVGPSPGRDATIEFAVRVWIDPASVVTPWGPTGTHTLFERVVRMSDGSWRLVESGTGP
ncbi:MAG: hypothetical protein NTW58_02300 [Actinobacteria bacterium]|nr:hypothetical protein [Actinomycetota bacterium]